MDFGFHRGPDQVLDLGLSEELAGIIGALGGREGGDNSRQGVSSSTAGTPGSNRNRVPARILLGDSSFSGEMQT